MKGFVIIACGLNYFVSELLQLTLNKDCLETAADLTWNEGGKHPDLNDKWRPDHQLESILLNCAGNGIQDSVH